MKKKWNFIPINWKVNTENRINWRDKKNTICDEDYVRTKTLRIFGISVFRTTKVLDAKHKLSEFTEDEEFIGYKHHNLSAENSEKKR